MRQKKDLQKRQKKGIKKSDKKKEELGNVSNRKKIKKSPSLLNKPGQFIYAIVPSSGCMTKMQPVRNCRLGHAAFPLRILPLNM